MLLFSVYRSKEATQWSGLENMGLFLALLLPPMLPLLAPLPKTHSRRGSTIPPTQGATGFILVDANVVSAKKEKAALRTLAILTAPKPFVSTSPFYRLQNSTNGSSDSSGMESSDCNR